jgi:hypothetical protein
MDSSFTLSGKYFFSMTNNLITKLFQGDQWDDTNERKTSRARQPPGGQSSGTKRKEVYLSLLDFLGDRTFNLRNFETALSS